MRTIFFPLYLVTLFSLFARHAMAAEEPSQVPTLFIARIGGFLGASYSVELRDGVLLYTSTERGQRNQQHATLTPSPAQWREFRQALDDLKIWQWRTDYPNHGVNDGTQWSLEIAYSDRSLKTHGDNNYPDTAGKPIGKPESTETFTRYLAAISKLLGGKSFQ